MRILKRHPFPVSLTIMAVIGAIALLFSTRWGIGLSPDSAIYIGAARYLLNGKGLKTSSYPGEFTPMTQYPPLFPTLLAAMGLTGIDPIDGARWLNAAFFAANIGLVGLLIHATTRSFWLSVFGSFFMMSSFPIVQIHSMAWSEPLFLFFGLLGLWLLAHYANRQSRLFLAASSVAMALSLLSRYAGVAWVMTGAIGTLLLNKRRWKERWLDTAIFFSVGTLPILLWMIRNLVVSGRTANREFLFHSPTLERLESAFDTISMWFLPPDVPSPTRWVSALVVATLMIIVFSGARLGADRNPWQRPGGVANLPLLLCIFILNYGLLLMVNVSFFDAHTPTDNRILSPLYVALLLLVLCLFPNLWKTCERLYAARLALGMLGLALVISHLMQSVSWLRYSYDQGIGYAGRAWRESPLIQRVQDLEATIPIFTNAPETVSLLCGRPAFMIPTKVNPGTRQVNVTYAYELAAMQRRLKEERGVLVYFSLVTWRWYLASEEELQGTLKLRPLLKEKDGTIYH